MESYGEWSRSVILNCCINSLVCRLLQARKTEDPRLSFYTPEFKEASRVFTQNLEKNFGKPYYYGIAKKYPWSNPTVVKLDQPVDKDGNPWPLDERGNPIP